MGKRQPSKRIPSVPGGKRPVRQMVLSERRRARRQGVRIFFNKYLSGVPHMAEALELSTTGLVARKIHEPDGPRAVVAVELQAGEEKIWLCATPVWQNAELEALRFVGASDKDRARIEALLAAS